MQKCIVSIIMASLIFGRVYAMDEIVHMAALVGEAHRNQGPKRAPEYIQKKREEMRLLRHYHSVFAECCASARYQDVREVLEEHAQDGHPVLSPQYGISLKNYVTTARIAFLLEKYGISLDQTDRYGSILHRACYIVATPMLLQYAVRRYCIEKKTLDINHRRTMDGKTPLHIWANDRLHGIAPYLSEAQEKLQILLNAGADWSIEDKYGALPLDILEENMDHYAAKGQKDKAQAYRTLINDLKAAANRKNNLSTCSTHLEESEATK